MAIAESTARLAVSSASVLTAAPQTANDNLPPGKSIDRWRCCIDGYKALGLTALAVYTAKCKLRGNETFDQFAERLIRAFTMLMEADRRMAELEAAELEAG